MSARFAAGPYSVHPYSEVQGPHVLGDGAICGGVTIGAGDKMLGEVTFYSKSVGFPRIQSEDEMRAVAALWIAAPDMFEALNDLLTRPTDGAARFRARAALAKAIGQPLPHGSPVPPSVEPDPAATDATPPVSRQDSDPSIVAGPVAEDSI